MPRRRACLVAVTFAIFGCSSTSATTVCERIRARDQRCGGVNASPCAFNTCVAVSNAYRSDAINAANCPNFESPCDAGTDNPTCSASLGAAVASGQASASYQSFARALCNACPTYNSTATAATMQQCLGMNQSVIATLSLDGGSAWVFVVLLRDEFVAPMTQCLAAIRATDPSACPLATACLSPPSLRIDAGLQACP